MTEEGKSKSPPRELSIVSSENLTRETPENEYTKGTTAEIENKEEANELLLTEEVFLSCMHHSISYINLLILHNQSKRHCVEDDIFYDMYRDTGAIIVNFKHTNNTVSSLHVILFRLRALEDGYRIFYSCLRETAHVCPGHNVLANEIEHEAKQRSEVAPQADRIDNPDIDEGYPVADDKQSKDVVISKEAFLAIINTSRSSINLDIIQKHRSWRPEEFFIDIMKIVGKQKLFFNQDEGELQYVLYRLCEGEGDGLQLFYQYLNETQQDHGILAFELEQQTEDTTIFSFREPLKSTITAEFKVTSIDDKLSEPKVTEEVVRSCINQSRDCINLLILHRQSHIYDVQRDIFKLESNDVDQEEERCLLYCDVDKEEIDDILQELQNVPEGFQIFYDCLRETQDFCPGHRILADDIEDTARRRDSHMVNDCEQSQGTSTGDNIEEDQVIVALFYSIHHQSNGFINMSIMQEHNIDILEQKNEEQDENILELIEDDRIYFKKDEGKLQYLLYMLSSVDGLHNFYRCLKMTQDKCYWHGVLAQVIEVKSAILQSTTQEPSKCTFSYSGKEITYFNPSGISMFFPNSTGATDVNFSVQIVRDDYILPAIYESTPLVSKMYKITTRGGPLPVPVTVRMEHCAVVEEEDSLIHMIAHGPPPYQFQPLPGGKFPIGESYGEIQLTNFSILTIIARKLGWRMSLSVQLFYHQNNSATFVMTKNISSLIQAVKREYPESTSEPSQSLVCDYATEAITFSIPSEPQYGWKIVPKYRPPRIQTTLIREFKEGKTPPGITFIMSWVGEGDPGDEVVDIGVEGCSIESFSLSCSASSTQICQKSPIDGDLNFMLTKRDMATIAQQYITNWKQLAPFLGLSDTDEENIKRTPGDYEEQKKELLNLWVQKNGHQATFKALIQAARDAKNIKLADDLEQHARTRLI